MRRIIISLFFLNGIYSQSESSSEEEGEGNLRNPQGYLDGLRPQIGTPAYRDSRAAYPQIRPNQPPVYQAEFKAEAYGTSYPYIPPSYNTYPNQNAPTSFSGTCKAGQTFVINSVNDLKANRDNLECIFSAAQTPDKIPLGPNYGDVLLAFNTELFNPIITALWKGKLVTLTKCRNTKWNVGFNFVANRLLFPTFMSVGPLELNLEAQEAEPYPKDSLILDYTIDYNTVCPYDADFLKNEQLGFINNLYPINQIVDAARVAGRQPDGGLILIGKAYMKDLYKYGHPASCIAFWSVVVYDQDTISTEFKQGQEISVSTSYSYTFPGWGDVLARFSPYDNALSDPIGTLRKYVEYVLLYPQGITPVYRPREVDDLPLLDERRTNLFRGMVGGDNASEVDVAKAAARMAIMVGDERVAR